MILVINSGSSSLKAALFDDLSFERLLDIRIDNIDNISTMLRVNGELSGVAIDNHEQALSLAFKTLTQYGYHLADIIAVGHRVVHGGEDLIKPTFITDQVEQLIQSLSYLAPLHNPICLKGIQAARIKLQYCPHIAVFDTAFHATLPARAKHYALPDTLNSDYQLQRFGFHGISHESVSQATAKALNRDIKQLRIISCHLGSGCSVAAIKSGRSVDTSMGMTPLEGLVMGSRCGDLDPGIIIQLLRTHEYSAAELDTLLNQKSGLLGMTGSSDMQEIEQRAAGGDQLCRRAIHVFTYRARKYIGAYAAAMSGVDAIVFTGGIGENSALIRHRIARRFDFLGAALDANSNRNATVNTTSPVATISTTNSRVKLLVAATDEEAAIATTVSHYLNNLGSNKQDHVFP